MDLLVFGRPDLDFTKLNERLYTGGAILCVEDMHLLLREGITHVLDARSEANSFRLAATYPGITYLANGTDDDGVHPKPAEWFDKAVRFALAAFQTPGAKLYSHCAAGVNRGPSLAYAILRGIGYSKDEAYKLIKSKRPVAWIDYRDDADLALRQLRWID